MSAKKPQKPSDDSEEALEGLWRPTKPLGLARAIAKAGYATRPQADAIVRSGRVQVDELLVTDPSVPVGPESVILLDGQPLVEVPRRYYALNKPPKVVTSTTDRGGRRHVAEFYPTEIPGLNPAGRLDANTEGLLLISNDSVWNACAAGSVGLEREYLIRVSGTVSETEVRIIMTGMHLPNIGFIRPTQVEVVEVDEGETVVKLIVVEGKNRQVRRIFSSFRHDVLTLSRVRIGPVILGNLPSGRLRPLTAEEIEGIRNSG